MFLTNSLERIRQTIRKVKIWHSANPSAEILEKNDYVVTEKLITLEIAQAGKLTYLCTPNHLKKLIYGSLFTQRIISSAAEVIEYKQNKDTITVKLAGSDNYKLPTTEKDLTLNHQVPFTLQMDRNILAKNMELLAQKQKLFAITGATHAAAIFNSDGKIITLNEDVGRHNALDKSIGDFLLQQRSLQSCGVALSSRVSFEMLNKIAMAGFEIIIAVSAPTSLAVEMANKWQITLCGFARDGKLNIYTHPQRVH